MSSAPPVILVQPYKSFIDQPVTIRGSGFKKNTKITVESVLQCSEEKLHFMAYGHYVTSGNGSFNANEMASFGGTSMGTDTSGLFWSMKQLQDSNFVVSLKDGRSVLNYCFNVYNGHITDFSLVNSLASAKIKKYVLKEDINREEIKIGNIRGTLFSPKERGSYPGIITLYGGNKSGHVSEDYAAYLANEGYVTLALAYFGVDGLTKTYTEKALEMEYFEKAKDFLKSLDNVNNKIGVLGRSKGGDIAFGMMEHLSGIDAVCTMNGSIVSVGTDLTYKGHTTKMIGANMNRFTMNEDGSVDISNALDNPRDCPSCIHQLQRSSADLLMIVGKDDKNWQSELFADIAKDLMDSVRKKNYKIIKYTHSGHFFDLPNTPIVTTTPHVLVPNRLMVYFGGKNRGMFSKERTDAWKQILDFFRISLKKTYSKL